MNTQLIKVKDVMAQKWIMLDGLKTVAEGLAVLREQHAEALIIDKRHEHDEYGLVLLSDIGKKVMARDKAADRVNLYEIMSKPVLPVHPDMDIRYCARLFEQFGINQAPVIDNHQVIGLISYTEMVLQQSLQQ
ncbi:MULTISPECIES: CBS domain-containing protein [Ferrimonas]|uniref:CBS domain-containing protein n=1 Tax=Ferrimonas TaxID=44011 RepID=UPI00041B0392|nr:MULTISPECIES: CBS domain-containing protein [Ferrimonas]USD38594.1 CBS domain-containing protein [Ferrimonas sp. SCSIO 43195]